MLVCPGAWSQSGAARPSTSGRASSAGPEARAAASASSTSAWTWEAVVAVRLRTPTLEPVPPSTIATTVIARPVITPLVVSVLLAQRRLAVDDMVTITAQ